MSKLHRKSTTEARNQFAALLDAAKKGQAIIITRHGRPIAALVPIRSIPGSRQKALTGLEGSGKGLWGRNSTYALRRLRDEWSD